MSHSIQNNSPASLDDVANILLARSRDGQDPSVLLRPATPNTETHLRCNTQIWGCAFRNMIKNAANRGQQPASICIPHNRIAAAVEPILRDFGKKDDQFLITGFDHLLNLVFDKQQEQNISVGAALPQQLCTASAGTSTPQINPQNLNHSTAALADTNPDNIQWTWPSTRQRMKEALSSNAPGIGEIETAALSITAKDELPPFNSLNIYHYALIVLGRLGGPYAPMDLKAVIEDSRASSHHKIMALRTLSQLRDRDVPMYFNMLCSDSNVSLRYITELKTDPVIFNAAFFYRAPSG